MISKIIFIITALLLISHSTYSQETTDENNATPTFQQQLVLLQDTLKEKTVQRKKLEITVSKEKDELKKSQLQQELNSANEIIQGLNEKIVQQLTGGAKLFSERSDETKEFDWKHEVEEIFKPILDQLKGLTEKPQKIKKIEADIVYWHEREQELSRAIQNLTDNKTLLKSKSLNKQVNELLGHAESRYNSSQQKLSLLKGELAVVQGSQESIWLSLKHILKNVVLGLLFHLLVAIAAGFLAFQLIRFFAYLLIKGLRYSRNNRKLSSKDNAFVSEQAVLISRSIIGTAVAIIVYIVVLYSLSEWLLVALSFLLLAAIAIGLKDTVPAYLVEIKTLLNIGSIRQDERIMFQDLPWKIKTLGLLTHLHNPALDGHLRVPLKEIINLSSRPYHKNEAWFPTRMGDSVLLEDGTFGQVITQTPEIVELQMGGAIYSFETATFKGQRPKNLSRDGFSIYENFGLDYEYQKDITGTINSTLQDSLTKGIEDSKYGEFLESLKVEFSLANSSSLDFRIIAQFKPDAAKDYFRIRRVIQKLAVEAANENNWTIPFDQLTIHKA